MKTVDVDESVRRTRSSARGDRTRGVILAAAAEIAAAEGLEGLSIGRLASGLEMSKSGLFAHFGSKEELQIATIEFSWERFEREVVQAAAGLAPEPGLARLWALADGYLSRLERKTVPGGCFLYNAVAEFDSRPGPVRDLLAAEFSGWLRLLGSNVNAAVARGELTAQTDARLLTFEISALLFAANRHSLLLDEADAFAVARRAILQHLRGVEPDSQVAGLPTV